MGITAVSTPSDSFVGQWLSTHQNRSTFSVGLSLNSNTDSTSTDGGSMDILDPDPNSFSGDIASVPLATLGDGQTPPLVGSSDWAVRMNGWSIAADLGNNKGGSGAVAMVEPMVPWIVVPQTAAPTMCKCLRCFGALWLSSYLFLNHQLALLMVQSRLGLPATPGYGPFRATPSLALLSPLAAKVLR